MKQNLTAPRYPIDVEKTFGIKTNFQVFAFESVSEAVPTIDPDYQFDPGVTLAILAGFCANRRTLIQGLHGTGKSSHIEQVAARLNWPCMRINLDGQISRLDLIGKESIVLEQGHQVTKFQEGLLLQCLQKPIALVLDEYDAGRPDVMFVIQQLLEQNGRYTSLEQGRVINPHRHFRLFATCNTLGLGDTCGMYSGTYVLNQSQLDRWTAIATLNYLTASHEVSIVLAKAHHLNNPHGRNLVRQMVATAQLTRSGFEAGDISLLMSPRTVITWAQNIELLGDIASAFRLSFLNRCDGEERALIAEYYQRCFDCSPEEISPVKLEFTS